tara:strand:+ start:884 stop:1000 length:117 start_codon:yes stop_codon:yes gene_type:complete
MPKQEEFDYELQKHLEKEIPELLMPITIEYWMVKCIEN